MDLTQLSDADLDALESGDLSKLSDDALNMLDAGEGEAPQEQKIAPAPYGFGREMLSGLTFGYGDELEAALTDTPIEAIRAGQSQYREENPMTSMGANLLGAAPTMLIPGGAAMQGVRAAGTVGKIARGASALGTGAAAGALSGSGEAVEGQRLGGAQTGAVLGAIGAPLGAGAGRVLGATGRGVRRAAQGKGLLPDVNQRANATLLGSIAASKTTPDALYDQLVSGQTLGELSAPLTDMAGVAVRRSPEIRGQSAELLASRQAARPQELSDIITSEIAGGEKSTFGQIEEFTRRQRQAASPLYDKAYAESGPIISPQIQQLMQKPSMQAAWQEAAALADEIGVPFPEMGEALTLQQANLLKQGLDGIIYGGKNPLSNISKARLDAMDQTRADFVAEVDKLAPPSYREARAISAGGFRDQEAADLGRQAWSKGPEHIEKFFSNPNLSESEKMAFRAGAAAQIDEKMSGVSESAETFRRLFNSPRGKTIVSMLSNIEGPSAITPTVRKQMQQADFGTQLSGGSQTQGRAAADELFAGSDVRIPTSAKDAVYQALQGVRDRMKMGDEKANIIGQKLLNPDLATNQNTLRDLQQLENILRQQAGQRGALGVTGAGLAGSQSTAAGNR